MSEHLKRNWDVSEADERQWRSPYTLTYYKGDELIRNIDIDLWCVTSGPTTQTKKQYKEQV